MKKLKQLGFEVLSQLNMYACVSEIHYKLNSYAMKIRPMMQGLQKEEKMLKEYLITEQKLMFMVRSL